MSDDLPDPLWSVMDRRAPLARKRMEGKPLTVDERAELDRLDALIDELIERAAPPRDAPPR